MPSVATRDKILEKIASEGGSAAALVARAVSAGHGADSLAIGLVCGVIFATDGPSDSLRDAAVRLEPAFGGSRVAPDAGIMLADAAGRVIARLDGPFSTKAPSAGIRLVGYGWCHRTRWAKSRAHRRA